MQGQAVPKRDPGAPMDFPSLPVDPPVDVFGGGAVQHPPVDAFGGFMQLPPR